MAVEPNSHGPDEAKDRRDTDIGLEAIEVEGEELGHQLRQHAAAQDLERGGPGGPDRLDRPRLDGLDQSPRSQDKPKLFSSRTGLTSRCPGSPLRVQCPGFVTP